MALPATCRKCTRRDLCSLGRCFQLSESGRSSFVRGRVSRPTAGAPNGSTSTPGFPLFGGTAPVAVEAGSPQRTVGGRTVCEDGRDAFRRRGLSHCPKRRQKQNAGVLPRYFGT